MTDDIIVCHEEVSRRGEFAPCEKPAVALRIDPEGRRPYPVCRRHVRSAMTRLDDLPGFVGTLAGLSQRYAEVQAWSIINGMAVPLLEHNTVKLRLRRCATSPQVF